MEEEIKEILVDMVLCKEKIDLAEERLGELQKRLKKLEEELQKRSK